MSALNIRQQKLDNWVISKQLGSPQQLLRELVGGVLFDVSQDECLSFGVRKGRLVSNKLPGTTLLNVWSCLSWGEQEVLLKKIAQILVKVRNMFSSQQLAVINEIGGVITWQKFLMMNSAKHFDVIQRLSQITPDKLTLVHGDLNLANLITDGEKLRVIDFEHVMVGPWEFELAPALFWQDEVSLPAERLIDAMTSAGMKCNEQAINDCLVLYFINQLRLADEAGDTNKRKLLVDKARERMII